MYKESWPMTRAHVLWTFAVAILFSASSFLWATERPTANDSGCNAEPTDTRWDLAGERQKLIMQELRRVGVAIECYAFDERLYPGPSGGVTALDFLSAYLVPAYIGKLLTVDAWGSEYIYWSNGHHYAVVSYGSDRAPDVDYDAVFLQDWAKAKKAICLGTNTDSTGDIVWVDGNHCRWYETEREKLRP
jgi:hypothetical protein